MSEPHSTHSSQADVWYLKQIRFHSTHLKIITQNFNGSVFYPPTTTWHSSPFPVHVPLSPSVRLRTIMTRHPTDLFLRQHSHLASSDPDPPTRPHHRLLRIPLPARQRIPLDKLSQHGHLRCPVHHAQYHQSVASLVSRPSFTPSIRQRASTSTPNSPPSPRSPPHPNSTCSRRQAYSSYTVGSSIQIARKPPS